MPRRRRDEGKDLFAAIGCADAEAIASGGSSVVYRARQLGFDRYVAVKVLTTPLLDDRAQRRFERELALSGRLSGHPNVVTVYASGVLPDRRPYVTMDFCSGGSLADRLARSGPLPVPHALAVGIKLAGVLELAAQQGILHRDVKPGNVLVTRFGEPALSDFGIAVLADDVSAATHSLTPVHAAPEVLERQTIGPAADQWSLASTLHTLLSGRPPFAPSEGEGLLAGMLHVLNDPMPPIPRADVPLALVEVLERALAKHAADRWPTTADFGRALQAVERAGGWGPTVMPLAELETPMAVASPPPAPVPAAPAASPWGTEDGDTRTWERHRPPPDAVADPATVEPGMRRRGPAPDWPAPVGQQAAAFAAPAPSVTPLAEAPPFPALPVQPPTLEPPAPAGEDTEHFARPRPASPPAPPEAPPPRFGRRGWWTVGGAAAAVLVVVAVVIGLLVGTGGHHKAKAPPSTFPPAGPRPIAQVENESGGVATVTWTDPGCSSQCVYVQQVNDGPVQTVSDPSRRLTVVPIKPGTGYTIVIGAVYEAGVQPAWSSPVCVDGCYHGGPPSSSPAGTSPAGG